MMELISLILVLGFIVVYIVIVEIFTVLFRITGLTKEKSFFQTISMFTNSGFTTAESEVIMSNPSRRKVAVAAMISGNIFSILIVSLVLNLLINIANTQQDAQDILIPALIAFGVFVVVLVFFRLPFIRKPFDKIVEKLAITSIKKKNHENIITTLDNYGKNMAIAQIIIYDMPAILKDKSLFESGVKDIYNINILLVKRKSRVVEVTKDTILQNDDVIVVFGTLQNIKNLFSTNKKRVQELIESENKEKGNMLDILDNYGIDALVEVHVHKVPKILEDKPLVDSGIKEKYSINVMMIKRNDMPVPVKKDTTIQQGDKVAVFGPYKNIVKLFE